MELLYILGIAVLLIVLGGRKQSRPKSRHTSVTRKKKLKAKIRPVSFEPFSGKAHVIDGDTIKVRGLKVRLAGVNAPELDMPYGQKAKWEMVSICKGKTVRVVPNGETSYDRIVATCYVDGNVDIGAELIRRGLARDIPVFTGGKYKHLETAAGRTRIRAIPYKHNQYPKKAEEEHSTEPLEEDIMLIDDDDDFGEVGR
jgi:endonuclease YncB( thermonuclease family)